MPPPSEHTPALDLPATGQEMPAPSQDMPPTEPEDAAVCIVSYVQCEIKEGIGLEWTGEEAEVVEDPQPARKIDAPTPTEKTTGVVPKVLRSHKNKDKNKDQEKYMVVVFKGGKKRAALRDAAEDAQKVVTLQKWYPATDDCPLNFDNGNGMISDYSLQAAPCQMKHLHKWYMVANAKGLMSVSVRVPADAFRANDDGLLWLHFADLWAIYRQERMDVNYIRAWCL